MSIFQGDVTSLLCPRDRSIIPKIGSLYLIFNVDVDGAFVWLEINLINNLMFLDLKFDSLKVKLVRIDICKDTNISTCFFFKEI